MTADRSPLALFAGFTPLDVTTGRARIRGVMAGEGPPVLLLHGYPESHAAWHAVAPALAEGHAVIVPDLPGYGRSEQNDDGLWDKREVATELVTMMAALGHDRFHLAGHDRGARVGYRMALDHPDRILSFCPMAVVPILDVWPAVDSDFAAGAFHWFLFLQEERLVETLLAADPQAFIDITLKHMAGGLDRLHPAALADYRAAFARSSVRAAILKDYRASPAGDIACDRADRAAGRKITCPVLTMWPEERLVAEIAAGGEPSSLMVWQRWADDVTQLRVGCGHLVPEHAASEVIAALLPFLSRAGRG